MFCKAGIANADKTTFVTEFNVLNPEKSPRTDQQFQYPLLKQPRLVEASRFVLEYPGVSLAK